ncbi:hypothetical protein QVD17_42070 [Tagetes erecta]|uniref:Uncharacterized protein n=1 Tax=Tagetes erecta TaxID=13708 RepID=A0AAD8NE23_TARER|nr:hypothetical protein QVD17_42070 [Tagetes erecta]
MLSLGTNMVGPRKDNILVSSNASWTWDVGSNAKEAAAAAATTPLSSRIIILNHSGERGYLSLLLSSMRLLKTMLKTILKTVLKTILKTILKTKRLLKHNKIRLQMNKGRKVMNLLSFLGRL